MWEESPVSEVNIIQMESSLGKATNLGPPVVSTDSHLVRNLFRNLFLPKVINYKQSALHITLAYFSKALEIRV